MRAEPPKSYAQFVSRGVNVTSELHDGSPWTEELGVQEMLDTLKFYQTTSFDTVHGSRAYKRSMMHNIFKMNNI